jgi:hypothetical protein
MTRAENERERAPLPSHPSDLTPSHSPQNMAPETLLTIPAPVLSTAAE